MKVFLVPLVFFAMAAAGFADEKETYRTFKDDQDRSIRAVIVRTGPEDVWIRRDDGQTFRVPISTFSEADRKYIAQWRQTNALKAPNAIEFSARRYSDGREHSSTESRRTTVERYGYIVTIKNNTPIVLENLRVEYRYYAQRGDLDRTGQKRPLERFTGSTRLEKLSSRGEQEFKTDSIALSSTSLKPDWVYTDTNRRRTEDALGGVWVRVMQGSKTIAEFSSPTRLKETESW